MAMIPNVFISKFIDLLIKLVEQNVEMHLGVPGEIQKLQRTLRTVNNVLVDAERRRIDDEAINDWLKELKDVLYDADDILDRCQIEVEKNGTGLEPFTASSWKSCLCPPLTCFQKAAVTHEIGSRIKDLNGRVEEISKRMSQFHLKLNSPEDGRRTSPINRQTSPIVEPDIVGSKIEEDTENLVKLLTAQDTRANVLVFAIMGTGGIGKTTLAQKIFNDERIKDNFQIKIWVCVSQEFSEMELLKEIFAAAGGVSTGGAQSRSQLEPLVEEQLWGKKFLLVLDDVWAVEVWDDLLRKPLASSAFGSRVVTTTRKEGVARQMKAVHFHYVEKLPLEDGWALLCKKVVLTGDEREILHLKDIGMEIVSKCDGLPLAIKTIGGVLCTKNRKVSDWKAVLNDTSWSVTGLPEQVQVALYLSYEDLPSHLKQCFLYCSLFPEDHLIQMNPLIRLWISEGFVRVQGSSSMEDVGRGYYTELIMRNLLLPDPRYYEQSVCKMHDLLRSLAQFLTQGESTTFGKMKGVSSSLGLMKLRRVYIMDKEMTEAPGDLTRKEYVRTLLVDGSPVHKIDNLFDSLRRLRVLSLENTSITALPDSLGRLVHLRYLNLSGSRIGVIPETIGRLKNLQYLLLVGCESLVSLPDSIVGLRSLQGLHVKGTMLDGLPSGLGRLEHLCNLQVIVPPGDRARGYSTLEEVGNLSRLRFLGLERLQRASSSSEARGAALLDKPELVRLTLHCTEEEHTEEEMEKIKEVFEGLCPPPCLELLRTEGYFGREFPTWMTSSAASILSNLRLLDVVSCRNCELLPPFGLYPNLDNLSIYTFESLTSIGHEFLHGGSYGGGSTCLFPRLDYLLFCNMPNWEAWVWEVGVQAMPCLTFLDFDGCPKLRSLPEGLHCYATALTRLIVKNCGSIKAIENLLFLEKLELKWNRSLATLSNLPSLRDLEVKDCPALQVMENLGDLRRMELDNCQMETLPEYLPSSVPTTELKSFVIHCSESLLRNICLTDGRPEWHKIKHFQRVSVYSPNKSLYAHYLKTPFSFITNLNAPTISSSEPSTS